MSEILLRVIVIVSTLTLLILCPSRADFWESVENFACDHKLANHLMDERRKGRQKAENDA